MFACEREGLGTRLLYTTIIIDWRVCVWGGGGGQSLKLTLQGAGEEDWEERTCWSLEQ